jgi:hypothetical protein
MTRDIQWVDDALKQSRELTSRNNDIKTHASAVHQGLWDEVCAALECLADRSERFKDCGKNGNPDDRILYKPNRSGSSGERIELHVTLSKAKDSIHAHGENVDVTFRIDKWKDGTVGLIYNDVNERYTEAAKRIMEPFFFPELNSKS